MQGANWKEFKKPQICPTASCSWILCRAATEIQMQILMVVEKSNLGSQSDLPVTNLCCQKVILKSLRRPEKSWRSFRQYLDETH